MNKKKLVKKLEEVCGELDTFADDHTLFQVVKAIINIQYKLEGVIEEIENESITENEPSEA